jgi:hypothetical protein
MPDKTPQIEKAARIIDPEAFGLPNTFHQPDEDGFVLSDRDEARAKAEAILSTTLEPSEAEIEHGARAIAASFTADEPFWEHWKPQARACLIAAARVRVGE